MTFMAGFVDYASKTLGTWGKGGAEPSKSSGQGQSGAEEGTADKSLW